MFKCNYCPYNVDYKQNLKRHLKIHEKQTNRAPVTMSVGQNVERTPTSVFVGNNGPTAPTTMYTQPTQIQSGFGSVVNSTTHIPIEKHNEVVGIAHGWKKECEKMQEAYQLLGEETNAIISYLETVLNANNIRYNLESA